jgi:hypothetical protein
MPNPDSLVSSIQLPNGASLRPFPTLGRETVECATALNLQTQIAPLIVLMECQGIMLKIMKPLIEIINNLPNPPIQALEEFSKAAVSLAPCLLSTTPASLIPFLRDLLCLEIRSLNCLRQNLTSAGGEGPTIHTVLGSYQATVGLLNLAGGLFGTAGLPIPEAPTLSGSTDTASLSADDAAVKDFIDALTIAADSLGGC